MNKLFLSLLLISASFMGMSQTISADHFGTKKSFKTDQLTGELKHGTIVLLTPNISMSFSRIQKTVDGWKFVGTVTPGASYNLVVGEGTEQTDGSVSVQPYVSIGAFADGGVAFNPETGNLNGSFNLGGTLGLYKYVTVGAGYDVIQKTPFFAIGATVSIFTFAHGAGATVLKF